MKEIKTSGRTMGNGDLIHYTHDCCTNEICIVEAKPARAAIVCPMYEIKDRQEYCTDV